MAKAVVSLSSWVPTAEAEPAEYVHVCTNELLQEQTQKVLAAVLARPPLRGNAVFGCGGLSVLNFASLNDGMTHAAVFDINPRVGMFWSHIATILTAEDITLENTKERIYTYLEHDPGAQDLLETEIASGLSFLSSEPRFARIYAMFRDRHFSFTRMDICQPEEFSSFFETQRSLGAVPHTIFISNIADYVVHGSLYNGGGDDHAGYEKFEKSLALIPAETIVIDAKKRTDADLFSSQQIHLKSSKSLMRPPCQCLFKIATDSDDYALVTKYLNRGVAISSVLTDQNELKTFLLSTRRIN